MLLKALLLFVSILFSFSAMADYLPIESYGFNSEHDFSVNRVSKYDSEVESDYLTYKQIGCLTKSVLSDSSDFFCASAGSLSGKRFLIDSYLITNKQIGNSADFRFQWNKEQDFFVEKDNLSFEFIKSIAKKHSLGAFGMIDTQKANDDFGISYNYSFNNNSVLRVQAAAYDFSRNDRNENSDRFEQDPYVYSISFVSKKQDQKFFISLFSEPKFIWVNEDAVTISRRSEGLRGAFKKERLLFTFEYHADSTRVQSQHEQMQFSLMQWQWDLYEFLPGARIVQRRFVANGDNEEYFNILPFFWFKAAKWESLKIGYEMTWQLSDEVRDRTEHRFNFALNLTKSETSTFDLGFSFDLDRFGKSDMWEGGLGNLTYYF